MTTVLTCCNSNKGNEMTKDGNSESESEDETTMTVVENHVTGKESKEQSGT